MALSEAQLLEIEQRAATASPAPWCLGSWQDNVFSVPDGRTWNPICRVERDDPTLPEDHHDIHDADFIAHARTDIPALLAEIRRLQAAIQHRQG